MPGPDDGEATIVERLGALELPEPAEAAGAVYDRPIGLRLLYEDAVSGEEHYVVRYPAGVRGRLHRHTAAHDDRARRTTRGERPGRRAGSYVHFRAGQPMRHQATDDGRCLFVLLFHGPFDVELVDD